MVGQCSQRLIGVIASPAYWIFFGLYGGTDTDMRLRRSMFIAALHSVWAELVAWALRLMKKPYVLILRGGNLPAFAQDTGKRVPHLLQSASIVIAPSPYLFKQMRPYRQDLFLLPNPLNLAVYSFKHRMNPAPRLVWLRAFHDVYNPSLAVRVLACLVEDFPSAQLLMMGPDKEDGSLSSGEQFSGKAWCCRQNYNGGSCP